MSSERPNGSDTLTITTGAQDITPDEAPKVPAGHPPEVTPEEIAALAATIIEDVKDMLAKSHAGGGELLYDEKEPISEEGALQVASYALRDIRRLEQDQKKGVSVSKYVAYVGFWLGKLKPVGKVSLNRNHQTDEILDINERLVLPLMDRLLLMMARANPAIWPSPWRDCSVTACTRDFSGKPVRGECYRIKNRAYRKAYQKRYSDYIAYGLRHRALSPYHLVSYLDQAMYMSCEHATPPIFEKPQD